MYIRTSNKLGCSSKSLAVGRSAGFSAKHLRMKSCWNEKFGEENVKQNIIITFMIRKFVQQWKLCEDLNYYYKSLT